MSNQNAQTPLRIIPLGGLHEIGKNTCLFEINDEIMLVDAGLAFPSTEMHGVNIVLPDMTYLRQNRHRIKGMIVTHGHEDHIGGIPFHLKQFDIPLIYGPRLAMALLQGKLEEAGVADRTELRTVGPRDIVRIGNNFFVEFVRNTHSIADSFSLAINTPVGLVIFTGDFKFDHTPVDGEFFDLQKLAEHGEKGVLCLVSDSTNSEVPGFTPSERSVFPNLDRVFAQAMGRLIVTTFASSVHRVNMILELAKKHRRVVSVAGRSMLNVIAHARNLGYIKCEDNLFVPMHMARQMPDESVLILTTGSQGEPMAALTRIANGDYKQLEIRRGDTVVFSANPIPGNTIPVVQTIDKLMAMGAKVVYGRDKGIHVSGHGAQEDQKLMLALTRPKFFVPVHGEHRMLVKHSETAQSMGVPPENMVIIQNGDVVELTPNSIQIGDKVPSGIELVDGSRAGVVAGDVLKERQQIAGDGVITIAAAVGLNGQFLAKPEVHLSGVVLPIERSLFQKRIRETLDKGLESRWSEYARSLEKGELDIDWAGLKHHLERDLQKMVRGELQGRPMLIFLFQTPEAATAKRSTSAPVIPVTASTPAAEEAATGGKRRRSTAKVAS